MKKLTFISVPLSYSDAKQLALDLGLRLLTLEESRQVKVIDSNFWVSLERSGSNRVINNSFGKYSIVTAKLKTVLTEHEEPKTIKQLRYEQAN